MLAHVMIFNLMTRIYVVKNTNQEAPIVKVFSSLLFPIPRPKYFPQNPILQNTRHMFLSHWERSGFTLT